MTNNRHESDEPFSKSAGGAALRGALLLFVALAVGFFLVRQKANSDPVVVSPSTPVSTDTTLVAVDPSADPGVVPSSTTPVTARAPEIVKVLVANGSGVNRAGARVRAFLLPLRYDLPAPADATLKNFKDFVYFNPGFEIEARDISSKLGLTSTPAAVPADVLKPPVPEFDVLVVVGPDMAVRYKSQSLTPISSTIVAPAPVA